MLTAIPIAFSIWGLQGAVWAVAAGDLPLYCVLEYGSTREGVRPLRQDLEMTGVFIVLLALEFAARNAIH
jgi:hypothetical protein